MTFVVRGMVAGEPAELVWTEGTADGSIPALARLEILLHVKERLAMTPTGPAVEAALEPDWVAARTFVEVFDDPARVKVEGDVSEPPYVRAWRPDVVY